MNDSSFDSNVILYLASGDQTRVRHVRALIAEGGHISVQVLNEVANVSRRKFKMNWSETHALLYETERLLRIWPLTLDVHHTGLRLAERYGFAVYDSFIVAAALIANCETLWSEDMQHGFLVDGRLRIQNPFAA